jgi:hypothetical protein
MLSSDVTVLNIFKPNAKLIQVVNNIVDLTKDFTKNDFVFVTGGSNDVDVSSHCQSTLTQALQLLAPVSLRTNVIMPFIFHRYDTPTLNTFIDQANSTIAPFIKNNNNNIIPVTVNLNYLQHYTLHGLHLNAAGSWLVTKSLVDMARSVQRQPAPSVNFRPVTSGTSQT